MTSPYEGLAPVIAKLARFDASTYERRRAESQAKFATLCLREGRCLAEEALEELSLLAVAAEKPCYIRAFQAPDAAALAAELEFKAAYEYLLGRYLKLEARATRASEFFYIRLEDGAVAALLAAAIGATREARWLSEEFLRHKRAPDSDADVSDPAFVGLAAFLADWYLNDRPDPKLAEGLASPHRELALAATAPADATGKAVTALIAARVDASRRAILEGVIDTLPTYGFNFPALFPVEMMLFARLRGSVTGNELARDLVVPPWLRTLEFTGRPWRDEFVVAAARKLDELELS